MLILVFWNLSDWMPPSTPIICLNYLNAHFSFLKSQPFFFVKSWRLVLFLKLKNSAIVSESFIQISVKKKPWGGLVSKFYFELFWKSSWNPEHFAWQCIYVVPWLIHPLEKRSRCGLRTSILYSHAPHAISATQSMMCRTNSKGVTRRWTPPGTKGIYLSFHLQWSWKGNWQKAILFLAPCCSCLPTESWCLHRMHWIRVGAAGTTCVAFDSCGMDWSIRRSLPRNHICVKAIGKMQDSLWYFEQSKQGFQGDAG
jgi:hypothetical protein